MKESRSPHTGYLNTERKYQVCDALCHHSFPLCTERKRVGPTGTVKRLLPKAACSVPKLRGPTPATRLRCKCLQSELLLGPATFLAPRQLSLTFATCFDSEQGLHLRAASSLALNCTLAPPLLKVFPFYFLLGD